MKKVLLIVIILVLVLFVLFLWQSGVFTKVVIQEKVMGPYMIVYEDHVGPYKNIGKVMDTIYSSLKKDNIEPSKGFGIYYDNPQLVPQEKLRSKGGCVIEEKDKKLLNQVKAKYKIINYNKQKFVIVEFPYKNNLAIMVGIFKVYPALMKYVQDKKYPQKEIIEMYDRTNKVICYMMPM